MSWRIFSAVWRAGVEGSESMFKACLGKVRRGTSAAKYNEATIPASKIETEAATGTMPPRSTLKLAVHPAFYDLWPMRVLSTRPLICLAAILFFPAIPGEAADSPNQQLYSFFNTFLEQRLAMHPLEATELGDHRFDTRLDDLSPDALKRSTAHLEQTLKQLPREVKYASLDRDGQIDYEIFEHDLQRAIWLQVNTKPFENDARIYNR